MPHIKVEHTKTINSSTMRNIFNALENILIKNAGVKKENCKYKSFLVPNIGTTENLNHFLHIEILILDGRTKEIKKLIGQTSLEIITNLLKDDKNNLQFSVEIREINTENYFTSNIL